MRRDERSLAVAALVTAVGLGAFLLFTIEFIVAKWLLPWFGGAASVWTTCMLFFQTGLLAGYAWAHRLATGLTSRRQMHWHLALVGFAVALLAVAWTVWPSPVTPGAAWRPQPQTEPIAWLLLLLAVSVGLPFVALSATGPLLQSWFTRLRPRSSPWPLYALSNLGSLLGVILYPFVFEPVLPIAVQGRVWTVLFAAYALCVGTAALAQARSREPIAAPAESAAGARAASPGLWWVLSIATSLGLLAVTSQLSLDVAVVPFLWMVPLVIYLGTFIWAFSAPGRLASRIWAILLVAASLGAAFVFTRGTYASARVQVLAWLVFLFFLCAFGHGELASRKPHASRLTAFYLAIAGGGAVGGLIAAIVAPLFFRGMWELPLALYAGLLLPIVSFVHEGRGRLFATPRRRRALLAAAGFVLFCSALLLSVGLHRRGVAVLASVRNFYGYLVVQRSAMPERPDTLARVLVHGRTVHGLQIEGDSMSLLPTTYFGPGSGVGRAIQNHPLRQGPDRRPMRVGVVGLGVGTLAAWGQPGDVFRFYEINAAVTALSSPPRPLFTYLAESRAQIEVVLGDARLSLEREAPQGFDLLVLDAFSSDSIPVHLLTSEAFDVYARHLRDPDSVIAVHLSNRSFWLGPVVRGAARAHGFGMVEIVDAGATFGTSASDWAVLSRSRTYLDRPEIRGAEWPRGTAREALWTDRYSNLLFSMRVLWRGDAPGS